MRGQVEIKRWVNLTGVQIFERSLGVTILPSRCIISDVSELNDKAIAKKLKSGIGTIVDTDVGKQFDGLSTIFFPSGKNNVVKRTGPGLDDDVHVECDIIANMGVGFTSWKFVGEKDFAHHMKSLLHSTATSAIEYIAGQMHRYYPGEYTSADLQFLKMIIATAFTTNEIADAVVDVNALNRMLKRAQTLLRNQRSIGRGGLSLS